MTDKLQIELVGADALLAQVNHAINQLEHPRALLEAVGSKLEGNAYQRFTSKTDAAGVPWKPVSPNTPLIYEAIHGKPLGGSLLLRAGYMRGALTHNSSDEFVEVGFGGSAPYAGFHVTGTKKMPRRDPLFGLVNMDATQGELGAQDAQDVVTETEDFLQGLLG